MKTINDLFNEFNRKGIVFAYYRDRKVLTIWLDKIPYDFVIKEIRIDDKIIEIE